MGVVRRRRDRHRQQSRVSACLLVSNTAGEEGRVEEDREEVEEGKEEGREEGRVEEGGGG